METTCVETMSDRELVARLMELLRQERRLTAAVLVHLGEVEARRLYAPAACPSKFIYCTRVLRMSEDQAFKRIRAARTLRRHPVVVAAVAEGRLHLSGVAPGLAGPVVVPGPAGQAARVTPLASKRFALQLTIGEATREKLMRAAALLAIRCRRDISPSSSSGHDRRTDARGAGSTAHHPRRPPGGDPLLEPMARVLRGEGAR